MIENLSYYLAASGNLIDCISTGLVCSREGIEKEKNIKIREIMEKKGVPKGAGYLLLRNYASLFFCGGILYSIDYLLDINNSPINFHKVFLYGYGAKSWYHGTLNSMYYSLTSINKMLGRNLDRTKKKESRASVGDLESKLEVNDFSSKPSRNSISP